MDLRLAPFSNTSENRVPGNLDGLKQQFSQPTKKNTSWGIPRFFEQTYYYHYWLSCVYPNFSIMAVLGISLTFGYIYINKYIYIYIYQMYIYIYIKCIYIYIYQMYRYIYIYIHIPPYPHYVWIYSKLKKYLIVSHYLPIGATYISPFWNFGLHPEVFLQDLPGRWRQGQLEAHAPEALIAQGQDLWRETLDVQGFSARKYRCIVYYI